MNQSIIITYKEVTTMSINEEENDLLKALRITTLILEAVTMELEKASPDSTNLDRYKTVIKTNLEILDIYNDS